MENITKSSMFENYSSVDFGNTTQHGNGTSDLNLVNLPLFLRVPQWNRLVAKVFICLMCVVGISGNIILIGALQRKKKKGSTDVYIIYLAVGDITTLLLNGPVDFLRYNPDLWRKIGSDWLCRLHFYVQHCVFLETAILILVIGLDRYFHVFRPHSTANLEKVSRPVGLAAYALSAGISVVFIFTMHQNDLGICELNPGFKHINGIVYVIVNLFTLVSSIALGLIYFKVTRFLKKREQARRLRIPEGVGRQQGADAIRFPTNFKIEQTDNVAIVHPISVASVSLEMDMPSVCNKLATHPFPMKVTEDVAIIPPISVASVSLEMDMPSACNKLETRPFPMKVTENVAIIPPISVASVSFEMGVASACNNLKPRPSPTKPTDVSRTQNIIPGFSQGPTEGRVLNDNIQRVARTTVIMSLVTLVYFVSTVLPLLALSVHTLAGATSEESDMALFLVTRITVIGNVAIPILFIISSSEFRQLTVKMFKSLCKCGQSTSH